MTVDVSKLSGQWSVKLGADDEWTGEVVQGVDYTSQKIRVLALTTPGSNQIFPEYGLGLRSYMDAPLGKVRGEINSKLLEQVSRWIPEIVIDKVETAGKPELGEIFIDVVWRYRESDTQNRTRVTG